MPALNCKLLFFVVVVVQVSLQRLILQMSVYSPTLILSISRVKELPLGRFKTTFFAFGFNAVHKFVCHLLCSSIPPTCFVILKVYALIHGWGMQWQPDHSTYMQTFS